MRNEYANWDGMFENALKISVPELTTERVIFTGMGGSYIPGKIAEIFDLNIDYYAINGTPKRIDEKTTVIAMSYSGNTSETISAIKASIEKGSKVIAITSGGKIEEMAKQMGFSLIKVKGSTQTRYSFPVLFTPLMKLLSQKSNEKLNLSELKAGIIEFKDQFMDKAKILSSKILKGVPVFYGSTYYPLAIRFKQEINENAKYPAFYGEIPEVNHNEVESYVHGTNLVGFVIGNERIDEVTSSAIGAEIISTPSNSKLKNVSSLLYLAGLTSLYIADYLKEDPEKLYNIPKCRQKTSEIFKL
ncbi:MULTISPECIES: bifunctional phosphoglucose/phosphomannose isomerase [Acidianus]|uniref:Phosphoheptose isomerase n=1 Tax=Candidatus Acidianus copahuensis TaxID=1160895 RepID=A0A031LKS3_9CREN|nr:MULTISPECIES: bifunctional phosphoglucose/phosphomannose isomerase [Acidianus]EZQ02095.1 phosphoheptose isomerase [Candidatus Acidianus copahuensis]NON62757.1 bifunctional phosphoglucose/phosphomannose isomerase [Acidianus sp. RZ1]